MTEQPSSSILPKALGMVGVALYVVTGVFPYAAAGLLAPPVGLVVLYAGWLLGLWAVGRLYRRSPPWTLVMPLAALAFWWLVLSLGETFLGWTA